MGQGDRQNIIGGFKRGRLPTSAHSWPRAAPLQEHHPELDRVTVPRSER